MGKLNLSDVVNDLATTEADLSSLGVEDTLTITYRPSAYTPGLESEMIKASNDANMGQAAPAVGLLLGLLVGWELENDGEPVPLTTEGLANVPVLLLLRVMDAIGAHMAGKAGVPTLPR